MLDAAPEACPGSDQLEHKIKEKGNKRRDDRGDHRVQCELLQMTVVKSVGMSACVSQPGVCPR